jgi:hypothetical protein
MQVGADLVGAGLPISNPWTALLGGSTNVTSPNTPARSNLEWFGLYGLASTTLPAGTGAATVVPVPVTPGLTITNVKVLVTGTAASAPTHSWAAIYAGTGSAPALVSQGTDAGSAAIGANAFYNFTFGTPLVITNVSTVAPNGFVYVALGLTATTIPTVASSVAITAAWYTPLLTTNPTFPSPLFFAATFGSSQGATAPTTITSTSAATAVPIVWLT